MTRNVKNCYGNMTRIAVLLFVLLYAFHSWNCGTR